jgi:hypothetical protein
MRGKGSNRPSRRETYQKVKRGLAAVQQGRWVVPLTKHLPQAYDFLGVANERELRTEVEELLAELLSDGPSDFYEGGYSPQRSYEDPPLGEKELWAYSWPSKRLGTMVYLKFALASPSRGKATPDDEIFFFVDCHESRPKS